MLLLVVCIGRSERLVNSNKTRNDWMCPTEWEMRSIQKCIKNVDG